MQRDDVTSGTMGILPKSDFGTERINSIVYNLLEYVSLKQKNKIKKN